MKNTKLLKNISPKHYDSYYPPYDKTGSIEIGNFYYFLADSALYKSNGSGVGTKIDDNIKDLQFSKLVKMDNKLFFSLNTQPSIFEVHPQNGYSVAEVYYFNQSKHGRRVDTPINMTLFSFIQSLSGEIGGISKIKELKEFKNFPHKKGQEIRGYELYWDGEENSEYGWKGLVVVLESYHDSWYVVGLLKDFWTP